MEIKKKVYIASRFDRKQEAIELFKRFKKLGYEISVDWTVHEPIMPYENNITRARQYSVEDMKGIIDCDLFILLTDKEGMGIYTELGAAIFSNLEHGKPKIYVIGDYTSNCMFYFHPSVNRRRTIDEVIKEIE